MSGRRISFRLSDELGATADELARTRGFVNPSDEPVVSQLIRALLLEEKARLDLDDTKPKEPT